MLLSLCYAQRNALQLPPSRVAQAAFKKRTISRAEGGQLQHPMSGRSLPTKETALIGQFLTNHRYDASYPTTAGTAASLRYTDLVRKPTDVLDMTSLTPDEFQTLVPAVEQAFQVHMAEWRLDGKPRTARRYTTYTNCPLPMSEDWLLFILIYLKTRLMNVLRSGRIDLHAAHGIALETRVERGSAHLRKVRTCFKFIFFSACLLCLAAERGFRFANYAVGYTMLYIGFTRRKC